MSSALPPSSSPSSLPDKVLFSMVEVSRKKATAQVNKEGHLEVNMFDEAGKLISRKEYKVTVGNQELNKNDVNKLEKLVEPIFQEMLERGKTDVKTVTITHDHKVKVVSKSGDMEETTDLTPESTKATSTTASSSSSSSSSTKKPDFSKTAKKIMKIAEKYLLPTTSSVSSASSSKSPSPLPSPSPSSSPSSSPPPKLPEERLREGYRDIGGGQEEEQEEEDLNVRGRSRSSSSQGDEDELPLTPRLLSKTTSRKEFESKLDLLKKKASTTEQFVDSLASLLTGITNLKDLQVSGLKSDVVTAIYKKIEEIPFDQIDEYAAPPAMDSPFEGYQSLERLQDERRDYRKQQGIRLDKVKKFISNRISALRQSGGNTENLEKLYKYCNQGTV